MEEHCPVSVALKPSGSQPFRLALKHLTLDPQLQSRQLKPSVVSEYADVMRRGGEFPPVLVVLDGRGRYYLIDGHHRVEAQRNLVGLDDIAVNIVRGTFSDALWLSWGVNRTHGLPRTREAKVRAIRAALCHPKWSKSSNRKIAEHIGCDHKTVGKMRDRVFGEFPTEGTQATPKGNVGVTKNQIFQACRLLAKARPEQFQFEAAELAELSAGHDSLSQLLAGPAPKASPVGMEA
jgi:hypothetical protein